MVAKKIPCEDVRPRGKAKGAVVNCIRIVLATFALAGGQTKADEADLTSEVAEPVKCILSLASQGFDLPVGIAVDVCGGSTDGAKTVLCFLQAHMHPNNGGLGLTAGLASALCRVRGGGQ